MAATYTFTGPLPSAGSKLGYCVICVKLHKGAFLARTGVAAKINEGNKLGPETVIAFDIPARWMDQPQPQHPLNEAVTVSMVNLPIQVTNQFGQKQQGMIQYPAPVCWSHIDGLTISESGVLGYSAADMPQTKGGVLLGGAGG
jgi:hypothetical protein